MRALGDSFAMNSNPTFNDEWNTGKQGCEEVLFKLRAQLRRMPPQVIRCTVMDRDAIEGIPAWRRITAHHLLLANANKSIFLNKANG